MQKTLKCFTKTAHDSHEWVFDYDRPPTAYSCPGVAITTEVVTHGNIVRLAKENDMPLEELRAQFELARSLGKNLTVDTNVRGGQNNV